MKKVQTQTRAKRDVQAELDELRGELTALRDQLAGEVRTRRIVVVDDAGTELIFSTITPTAATFEVTWPADDPGVGSGHAAVLQASNELGGESVIECVAHGERAVVLDATRVYKDPDAVDTDPCPTIVVGQIVVAASELDPSHKSQSGHEWFDVTRQISIEPREGVILRGGYWSEILGRTPMQVWS